MPARLNGGDPLSERGTHQGSGFKINLTSGARRGHSGCLFMYSKCTFQYIWTAQMAPGLLVWDHVV